MPRYGHITDVALSNIYNRLAETLTRIIYREGSITHFNLTFTAAGSQTIYTPSTGKKAQILAFFLENTSDVEVILRFTTSQNPIAALPAKGVCAMNLIGLKAPEGSTDETVEVYASGSTNVRGWICRKEI